MFYVVSSFYVLSVCVTTSLRLIAVMCDSVYFTFFVFFFHFVLVHVFITCFDSLLLRPGLEVLTIMSVFVGASVLQHISATAYQNFTKLPVCGRYAVLLGGIAVRQILPAL